MYIYLKESLQFHLRNVSASTNKKSQTYLDCRGKQEGGVVVAAGIQVYTAQQEDRRQYSSGAAVPSMNMSTQVYL